MSTNSSLTFHWQDDDLDDDNFQIRGNTRVYILILFAIILIVTIIFFLYSRCSVTSASGHYTSPPTSLQLRGLSAAAISNLPVTVHRRDSLEMNETTSECSICLGGFEDGEKVKVLPVCCHRYHCECVDKWLVTHLSCPVCRTSVRVDSPV